MFGEKQEEKLTKMEVPKVRAPGKTEYKMRPMQATESPFMS
jgi:hypothetical protein